MEIAATEATCSTPAAPNSDLSVLLITLLKGVLYRDDDERLWAGLLTLGAALRDYVALLNLELVLDEAEGYAFLRGRADLPGDDPASKLPRLVARRALSFSVSLLLALLRKKLAEFDASGAALRLILTRDEVAELVRVFLPESSNQARWLDQLESQLNKIVELGFLRPLKVSGGPATYEVRRILKAFVDAQWLADFAARLDAYRAHLCSAEDNNSGARDD